MLKKVSVKLLPFIWIILAIVALIIRQLLVPFPHLIENYYSRGLFVGIRAIFDAVTWISPIPLIYVSIGILLIFLTQKIVVLFKSTEKWEKKLFHFGKTILNTLGFIVFSFLVLWGFNYQRIPLENQLGMTVNPLSLEELKAELDWATPILISLRRNIPNQSVAALDAAFIPPHFESFINTTVQDWLSQHGYPRYSKANARFLEPKGALLVYSTAGIYFPFVGESNIDAGLAPLTKPYILAHELAHAYGFGDEGSCNFIAYLACRDSDNPFVAYSGMLGYWRTLASNYKSYKPLEYAAFRAALPAGIVNDLNQINATHAQYPDIFPNFRRYSYDAFLKAQGIDEGLENYNRVLMLGRAWRVKNKENMPN